MTPPSCENAGKAMSFPGVFIIGFSQLSARSAQNKQPPATRVAIMCYTKKHLSHTIELFRPIVTFKGKVFLYGNSSPKFSAHKMAMQVSYRIHTNVQKKNNIFPIT